MSANVTRRTFLSLSAATALGSGLLPSANAADTIAETADAKRSSAGYQGPATLALVQKDVCSLGFYDLSTGRNVAEIPLPEQSHEIAGKAGDRFAYVSQYGVKQWAAPGDGGNVISVVDLVERKISRTIDLTPYRRLHGTRMDANGRLYVLSETSSVIARFDHPESQSYPSRLCPVGGVRSHYFVIDASAEHAFVCDTLSGMVIRITLQDASRAPVKVTSGDGPEGCCLSADEGTFYSINRHGGDAVAYSARSMKESYRSSTHGESVRLVALADGRLLLANAARKSVWLKRANLSDLQEIPLPSAPTALTLDEANARVFVSVENNQVVVINTRTWKIDGSIAVKAGADSALIL